MISSDIAIVVCIKKQYRYIYGQFTIDHENVEIEEVRRFDEIGKGTGQLMAEAMAHAEKLQSKLGNDLTEYKVFTEAR